MQVQNVCDVKFLWVATPLLATEASTNFMRQAPLEICPVQTRAQFSECPNFEKYIQLVRWKGASNTFSLHGRLSRADHLGKAINGKSIVLIAPKIFLFYLSFVYN